MAVDDASSSDVLQEALRYHFGTGATFNVRSLPASSAAWDQLIDDARNHCCLSILYDGLTAAGVPVPAAVRGTMRQLVFARSARSVFLSGKLRDIVGRLDENGIEALCVKGPMLAELAYGDGTFREYDDLDFLVREAQFGAARSALLEWGFTMEFDVPVEVHTYAGWDCIMWGPARDYFVELGTIGMPRYFFSIPPRVLWKDTMEVPVAGSSCRAPAVETQLVLLAAHGAKHGWCRYMWVADVAGLMTRSDINWDRLFALAQGCGAARMLRVALVLASEVCGLALPDVSADFVERDLAVPWLVEDCLRRLRHGRGRQIAGWSSVWLNLRCRERLRDRLRYLWLLAVLPGYSDWKNADRAHYWMYYVRRPFRLLGRCLRRP